MDQSVLGEGKSSQDNVRLAFETALDSASEGVWEANLTSGQVYLSPGGCLMLGLQPDALPAFPAAWLEIVLPPDRPLAEQAFRECAAGTRPSFDIEVRANRFGDLRWVRLRGQTLRRDETGRAAHLIGAISDLTERRVMEEELRASEVQLRANEVQLRASEALLRESESRYQVLFQNSPDAVFVESIAGQVLEWNAAANRMFGYSDEEFAGLSAYALLPPYLADILSTETRVLFLHGEMSVRSENMRKNGEIFPVEVNLRLIYLQGQPRQVVTVRDITGHVQAQNELARQLRFTEAVLNALPNPVFYKDLQGRYLGCNPAFTELFGLTEDQIRGKTVFELWPEEQNRVYHQKDLEITANGRRQRYESQVRVWDGSLRDVHFEKDVFFDEHGQAAGIIGSFIDITERKRSEKIQTAIYRISEAVQTVADLHELYREIHLIIGRLMEAKNFYIALLDEQEALLRFPYSVDEMDEPVESIRLDQGITSYVFRTGQPLLATPEVYRALVERGEVKAVGADPVDWLGVPLKTPDKTIGVMVVQSYSTILRYTTDDQDVLGFISSQVALAIERKRAEEQIHKLNRTLQTISQVNQALVRAADEGELMRRVCQILARAGGYPLVWIGVAAPDGQGFLTQEMAGEDGGFLARWVEEGQKTLIAHHLNHETQRRGQPVVLHDLHARPPGDLLGQMAQARGYHAMMVLPLIYGAQKIGAVHVCAQKPDAFQGDELDLLNQMADDLAFGIAALRSRALHLAAEQELRRREAQLRESEEKYRSVVERASDGIAIIRDARIEFANGRLAEMLQYDPADLIGAEYPRLIAPHALPELAELYQHGLGDATASFAVDTTLIDSHGREIEVEINPTQFTYQDSPAFLTIIRDISERKRAEKEHAQRLAELEAVNRISTALRTAHNLDDMLARLVDETLAVMDTPAGAIKLYNSATGLLDYVVARGWFSNLNAAPETVDEGIGGLVFSTGKAYSSKEFAADPNTRPPVRLKAPPNWGGVCMPIYTAAERVGILYLSVPSERELKPEEIHLLTNLAEIAGNAIYRERLHRQSELHVRRLKALHTFDMTVSSNLDLRRILDDLLVQVTGQLAVDAADVLLFNEQTQSLEYAAGSGLRGSSPKRARLRLGEGFAGKAALDRGMVAIHDLSQITHSLAQGLLWQGEGFLAYYGAPLIAKGQVEGVLEVFHRAPLTPDLEWLDFLDTLAARAAMAIMDSRLFENLQRSNAELRHAYDTTIIGWSRALELRDRETKDHGTRVVEMTITLAREMGIHNEEELIHIRRGALLHDIGKVGVPDTILRKPGKLDENEWIEMRKHPQYAYDLLSTIPYLNRALDIPYSHHEKWDGSGYPQGLKGEQIPLAARIFSVIDVWDALTNNRVYGKAWEKEKVIAYIQDLAGAQFDPRVVDAFMRCTTNGAFSNYPAA